MNEVLTNVYVTDDYEQFKKLEYNRDVSEQRVDKIIASFGIKRIINPIIVNSDMEVVDGQGRLEACKRLGIPVHYIIDPDATIEDCRNLNHYCENWKAVDFMNSYADGGNLNYIRLREAMSRTHLTVSAMLRLGNRRHNNTKGSINTGNLKWTDQDTEKAIKRTKIGYAFVKALQYTGRINQSFWDSVSIIDTFEDFDLDRMLNNMKFEKGTFVMNARTCDTLKELERIYNTRGNKNKKIYFTDYLRHCGRSSYNTDYAVEDDAE